MPQELNDPANPLDAVTHPDPYAHYAALRNAAPLSWCAPIRAWLATDAATVEAVLLHPAARVRPLAEPVPSFMRGTPAGALFGALARMTDGEAHATARTRVMARLAHLDADQMQAAANVVLVPLAADWHARHDDLALDTWIRRLPVTALLAAQGHPDSVRGEVVDAIEDWVAGLSPLADETRQAAALVAADRLSATFAAQGIAATEDAAARLAVLMQAHEATAGLIAAGVLRLAVDVSLRGVAAEGRLDWQAFGAEVLRHDPPIQNTRRVLAADVALHGQLLGAGDTVLLLLGSAAHDAARCERPEEFRLDCATGAAAGPPLGAGPHACPGGDIAVTLAICAWRHLLTHAQADDWPRWAAQVHWRPSLNARLACFAPARA